jgi:excisionase family DNA binding protein
MQRITEQQGSPRLLTLREIAEVLRIGEDTVRRLVDEGRIPCLQIDERRLRFDVERVLAALGTTLQVAGDQP